MTPEKLAQLIRALDRPKLLEMAQAAREIGKPDAARVVAQRCMQLAEAGSR
jgi:UDP-N-acetylglucosamine:LPS N-acetylglucosamine transferase